MYYERDFLCRGFRYLVAGWLYIFDVTLSMEESWVCIVLYCIISCAKDAVLIDIQGKERKKEGKKD